MHGLKFLISSVFFLLAAVSSWAATGGSISGSVLEQSGAVIPGATLKLVNTAQRTAYQTLADQQGRYSFPNLAVGHYDLTITATGFTTEQKPNIAVDTDSALRVDVNLYVGAQSESVTVTDELGAQVDTVSTHLGEVISGEQMTELPLNGRSYTDLLAIQPGVAPMSTLLPNSVIMAGVTGSLDPSGDENPGNLSINGQRESSNGFMVDGIDVQEHMNGGTSVIPNLDSIEQFRVLTNNYDPEYGNYNGGVVTVITKQGSNRFHGDAFEFLRNTALDARGYFDLTKAAFRQNQFGGTSGGPIKRDQAFFFADYQGTHTTQGIPTGLITVPAADNHNGIFNDLTGCVSGPYLASILGSTVQAGDPYSPQSTGCSPNRPAVFPNGQIPQTLWSAPGTSLLSYIPLPNRGATQYSSAAFAETVRDDKGAARIDVNSRLGQVSG